MLKVNWEQQYKDHPTRNTADSVIYPLIFEQSSNGYYDIFGLKIYASCTEYKKRAYAQKIVNFIQSLEDDDFILHYADYENPKLDKGEFFASISNCIQPERLNEMTSKEDAKV